MATMNHCDECDAEVDEFCAEHPKAGVSTMVTNEHACFICDTLASVEEHVLHRPMSELEGSFMAADIAKLLIRLRNR